jgi:hypothetical protein
VLAGAGRPALPHHKSREPQAGKGGTTLGARAGRAGTTTPHRFPAASYRRKLFERAGDAVERAVELCAKREYDGDNRDRNAGGDKAIFDGGRTSLLIHETQDKLSHGQPLLRYLLHAPTTMWCSTFDRVNAIIKNVDDLCGISACLTLPCLGSRPSPTIFPAAAGAAVVCGARQKTMAAAFRTPAQFASERPALPRVRLTVSMRDVGQF